MFFFSHASLDKGQLRTISLVLARQSLPLEFFKKGQNFYEFQPTFSQKSDVMESFEDSC